MGVPAAVDGWRVLDPSGIPAGVTPGNDTFALILYLSTFLVGFLVWPFVALFFGRIGDTAKGQVGAGALTS